MKDNESPMEDRETMEEEEDMKHVIVQAGPLVRLLLSSIGRHREFEGRDSDKALLLTDSRVTEEEKLLALFRTQIQLVERLRETLNGLATSSIGHRKSLSRLADYLTLPLTLIIRSRTWSNNESQQKLLTTNQLFVRQSAHWKTIEVAANTLSFFVRLTNEYPIPAHHVVRCLTSCAMALQYQQVTVLSGQLDRGEDCTRAILHCTATLVETHKDRVELWQQLMEGLDNGNLFALLVHGSSTWLRPLTNLPNERRGTPPSCDPQLQLQALSTLQSLLEATALHSKAWQNVFPGLLTALFEAILAHGIRQTTSKQASPKVAAHAVEALSLLLTVTLRPYKRTVASNESVDELMLHLESLGGKEGGSDHDHVGTWAQSADSKSDMFQKEANERLPPTFVVLLNMLPSTSSPHLRRSACALCRSLLLKSRHAWNPPARADSMLQASMECCLILTGDSDERVRSSAQKILNDYESDLGGVEFRNQARSVMVPRILDLLRELPVLCRSQQEVGLRSKLSLLCAYFKLSPPGGLATLLASQDLEVEIRGILVGLFDMDFESLSYSPLVSVPDSSVTPCRSRFLTDDMEGIARRLVRLLGNSLGIKQTTLLVDAIIADFFQATVARIEEGHSPCNTSHVGWLHERCGAFVVAKELLDGSFGEEANASRPKVVRKLLSLCKAVLPVMTSSPLWNLPTVSHSSRAFVREDRIGPRDPPCLTMVSAESSVQPSGPIDHGTAVSASALKGNACVAISLLEMLKSMSYLVGEKSASLFPIILYPLCEKLSSRNHSRVQNAAFDVLQQLAAVVPNGSISVLLSKHFDYILGPALSKIRSLGGSQYPSQDDSYSQASDVASIVLAVLHQMNDGMLGSESAVANVPRRRSLEEEANVSYVIELVGSILNQYDRTLEANPNPIPSSLELAKLLGSTIRYVGSSLGFVDIESIATSSKPDSADSAEEPWLELLEPFRNGREAVASTNMTSPKEGFEAYREKQETNDMGCAQLEVSDREIEFTSNALKRCSFFLSFPSRKVHVESFKTMQASFLLLGAIALHHKDEEINGPRTAIYREINSTFPTILARLKASASITTQQGNSKPLPLRTFGASGQLESDVSHNYLFLSCGLELLATMCKVSDDFMASRVKNDVWPILNGLLGSYLNEYKTFTLPKSPSSLLTERDRFLYKLFEFLGTLFENRECGSRLAGLIPQAGTILLPFLGVKGETGSKAMEAIKAMLLIDSDTLWRALVAASGDKMPQVPLGMIQRDPEPANEAIVSTLEVRAKELISFVEALPEQSI